MHSQALSRLRQLYRKYGAAALALLAALIMALTLFSGGGAGLSNNGDFGRVMNASSLAYPPSGPQAHVYQSEFRMVFQGESRAEKLQNLLFSLDNVSGYPSIHLLFVRLSMAGNLALNLLTGQSLDLYRVEVLGLLCMVLYALLLFLLFRSFSLSRPLADLLLKLLMLFVLCDEGYITYFNSLYSESVQILSFLAMSVFALRLFTKKGREIPNALLFFLSCVFYGWCKFVNLPAAALCAVGVTVLLLLRGEKKLRPALLSGCLLTVCLMGAVYLSLPGWMDYETNYNAVFYGVLKDTTAQQQEEYLADLGLPAEMAQYASSNYYMDRVAPARESREFREAFSQVSKLDLLSFYLRHPGYFLQKQTVAMAHCGFIRPYYLSNLGPEAPRLTFAGRFGLYSALRGALPFNTWWFTALLIVAACLVLWRLPLYETGRKGLWGRIVLLGTLLGSMAYQFFIPIITNGEGDLAKHMFAFAQWIDLLLLLLLAVSIRALCAPRFKHPAALFAGGLAALLSLLLLLPLGVRALRQQLPHKQAEPGTYLRLGEWEGRPLLWQVAKADGGSLVLLSVSAVESLPFSGPGEDGFGSNLWAGSSLRVWLNGPFLADAFSPEERALLRTEERPVILSSATKALADAGYNDFFAFHVPAYSDRGAEDALSQHLSDAVRLPDIGLMASFSRQGLLTGPSCWMETPYYNNGSMVRYLGGDGYFYMRDASQPLPVRPVIQLPAGLELTGSGSIGDPFCLE